MNIGFGQHCTFGWPDMVLEPRHQSFVVRHPAHQAHRGMCMEVHEAGNQNVVVQPGFGGVGVFAPRHIRRHDGENARNRPLRLCCSSNQSLPVRPE